MKPNYTNPLLVALLVASSLAHAQPKKVDEMKGMDMPATMPGKTAASHTAIGVVKKVDAKSGSVTLAHEPVTSLDWPSMTMGFKVKDAMLFDKLVEGRKIEFVFTQQGRDYVVESVK